MNFKDAKSKKEEVNEVLVDGNRTYKSMIVPENDVDFQSYIKEFRISNFTDESAIIFSKNSKFKICWLWTDGANVSKKNLI